MRHRALEIISRSVALALLKRVSVFTAQRTRNVHRTRSNKGIRQRGSGQEAFAPSRQRSKLPIGQQFDAVSYAGPADRRAHAGDRVAAPLAGRCRGSASQVNVRSKRPAAAATEGTGSCHTSRTHSSRRPLVSEAPCNSRIHRTTGRRRRASSLPWCARTAGMSEPTREPTRPGSLKLRDLRREASVGGGVRQRVRRRLRTVKHHHRALGLEVHLG